MEITFIKDHLTWTAGQTTDVAEERAAYWIKTGVAIPADGADDTAIEKNLAKKLKASAKKLTTKKK